MSTHLTPEQRQQLQAVLEQQSRSLEQELQLQLQGSDRVSHAREQLLQAGHDEREHDADREVDLARSDATLQALREIHAAEQRLRDPDYGLCSDCGCEIPFERLRLQPQAQRCISCQQQHETRQGGTAGARL